MFTASLPLHHGEHGFADNQDVVDVLRGCLPFFCTFQVFFAALACLGEGCVQTGSVCIDRAEIASGERHLLG